MKTTPVEFLVFDPQVGKVHLLVEVRQLVFERPPRDLRLVAIGMAVVVIALTIALVQPPLIIAFELVVEDDALDARAAGAQPLRHVEVRLVDLRVVFDLARAFEASVERLAAFAGAVAVLVEEIAAAIGQDDGDIATPVQPDGIDQSLFAQMAQIAATRIGGSPGLIPELGRRHDPKRAHRRQRACLGAAQ